MFTCRHAPLVLAPQATGALEAAYGESHRAYHTATHITEVLRWFDVVAEDIGWRDPAAVYLAILFHDAVYDPLARDNEARSAKLAHELVGASARVEELILLTARHGEPIETDADAAHFLDCDMAILGSSPGEFAAYDAAVAVEYGAVPVEQYRAGRRKFLAGLLAAPRIFLTPFFHDRLDAAARANLAHTLGH